MAPEQEQPGDVDELGVWVYPYPSPAMLARLPKRALLPMAAMSPYARVSATLPEEPGWALGVGGEFAGWLALRTRSASAGPAGGAPGRVDSFIGAPLTTCALWRFGQGLLAQDEARPLPADKVTCLEGP